MRNLRAKSPLKTTLSRLEPVQCVEQLKPSFTHVVRTRRVLFGMLNRKPDTINCYTRLVRQLKLKAVRRELASASIIS